MHQVNIDDNKFRKAERLYLKGDIENLFKEGKSFRSGPFIIHFRLFEKKREYPARVLISVPRRIHNKAFTRNRIKRQVREGYRKNKNILNQALGEKNKSLDFAFIYKSSERLSTSETESKIILTLQRLINLIQKQ